MIPDEVERVKKEISVWFEWLGGGDSESTDDEALTHSCGDN